MSDWRLNKFENRYHEILEAIADEEFRAELATQLLNQEINLLLLQLSRCGKRAYMSSALMHPPRQKERKGEIEFP